MSTSRFTIGITVIDLGRVPALEGVDVQPGQKGMLFPRCVRHNVPEHDIGLSHGFYYQSVCHDSLVTSLLVPMNKYIIYYIMHLHISYIYCYYHPGGTSVLGPGLDTCISLIRFLVFFCPLEKMNISLSLIHLLICFILQLIFEHHFELYNKMIYLKRNIPINGCARVQVNAVLSENFHIRKIRLGIFCF